MMGPALATAIGAGVTSGLSHRGLGSGADRKLYPLLSLLLVKRVREVLLQDRVAIDTPAIRSHTRTTERAHEH